MMGPGFAAEMGTGIIKLIVMTWIAGFVMGGVLAWILV